jgi:hypothetical protein
MYDAKLYFATDQAVTAAAVSEFYLDCNSISEIGAGTPLYVNVYVTTAFSADSHTMDIVLCSQSNGAPTNSHKISELITGLSNDTGGALVSTGLVMKAPLPAYGLLEYIGLYFDVSSAMATGTITAFLSLI